MPRIAWLFLRGPDSVRIQRRSTHLVLEILGPGEAHQSHTLPDEDALIQFLVNYERKLLAEGWILQAYEDRRSGRDRRGAVRGPDRRRRAGTQE